MTDSIGWGYYVGNSENPTTTNVIESNSDSLYYPHNAQYEKCSGYWLASPSADNDYSVVDVNYSGNVTYGGYGFPDFAFRPVVCLPISAFK